MSYPFKVKKGLLHKKLGIPQDKPIKAKRLAKAKKNAKKKHDVEEEREIVFAQNARKWHHK